MVRIYYKFGKKTRYEECANIEEIKDAFDRHGASITKVLDILSGDVYSPADARKKLLHNV